MTDPSAEAIKVDDLHVTRGGHSVLRGIGTVVGAGTLTGLIGPSGSGKTTLMRCIVGVQRIDRGGVTVLGVPAGDRALRRRMGYLTQSPAVYRDLSVRANLQFFAAVLGVRPSDIDRVVGIVGLTEQLDQRVDRLSGGQRTRVGLATALLGDPKLLVLDEPTVGQDPVLRAELWQLFRELAAGGVTLVVSSHVMDEAARCDRVLLLRDGAVLADASPATLRAHAGTDDLDEAFLRLVQQGSR